jgi:outer membrane lipoprotein-sorting protein
MILNVLHALVMAIAAAAATSPSLTLPVPTDAGISPSLTPAATVDVATTGPTANLSTTETLAAAAPAAPPAMTPDPIQATSGTLRMLRTLETFHREVKTVYATFDQVRVDALFPDEVRSRGELWYLKPYLFRCDYADPNPMITLILEKTLYNYTSELNQVDFWDFESSKDREQQLHQLLIGFGFDTDELIRIYEIHSSEDEAGPLEELKQAGLDPARTVLFDFTPRPERAETSPFVTLKLYIDKASHLPEKIWYEDPNDATMTLTMRQIETDQPPAAETFDPKMLFPAGVYFIDKRKVP